MKKSTRNIYICLLTMFGLVLALPFAPLRQSLTATISSYKQEALVILGTNKFINQKLASSISGALQLSKENYIGDANYAYSSGGKASGAAYGGSASKNLNSSGNYIKDTKNDKITAMSGGMSEDSYNKSGKTKSQGGSQGGLSGVAPLLARSSANKSSSASYQASANEASKTPSKSSAKQMAAGGPPPDSSEEDTPIPPVGSLPLGDGSLCLALLAATFGLLKMRKQL